MEKPLLYDLFSGAGGAAKGYQLAGFRVVGVDHRPQPRYCGEGFVQADVFDFLADVAAGRYPAPDAWHASPPCQRYSAATRGDRRGDHPDHVARCREALRAASKPWVMENVEGSPLGFAVTLCGSMFGMKIRRHRVFESSHLLFAPPCRHAQQPVVLSVTGTGYGGKHPGHNGTKPRGIVEAREVMGVDWPMTIAELSNAVPPAFTRHVGRQLLRALEAS